MARPLPRFTVPLAAVAILAPVALGVATHFEHVASARPAFVIAPTEIVPIAVPTPVPSLAPVASAPDATTDMPPATVPDPEPEAEPVEEREHALGDAPEFFFTVRTETRTYVVLSQEVEDDWAASEPVAENDWGNIVGRAVDMDAIPEALASWQGKPVDTYGPDGQACPGRVGELRMLAQANGDLALELEELEAGWDGYDDGDYDEIIRANAPAIWDIGRKLLVAQVDSRYGCVADARLALEHSDADPLVYRPNRSRGAANFEPGRAAVLATDRFQELAVEYDDYTRDPDPALGLSARRPAPLKRHADATAWFTPEGEAQLVSVIVDGELFGDCGGLPRPWGIAAVGDGGDLVLGDAASDEWGDVIAVMDLDRDGNPEILANGWDRQLVRLVDGRLETVAELESIPFFGCPC